MVEFAKEWLNHPNSHILRWAYSTEFVLVLNEVKYVISISISYSIYVQSLSLCTKLQMTESARYTHVQNNRVAMNNISEDHENYI